MLDLRGVSRFFETFFWLAGSLSTKASTTQQIGKVCMFPSVALLLVNGMSALLAVASAK